ncbi:TIGR01621 family pseudouridine synthase [Marinomonas pollencensis]|uniref:tRNA pseudouridine32 synthase/23S rRNA pseudouridine746 synthase n=1 Tax=Marinomonas pollencensis TaxID=491954 RepID=A0A3E0DKU6_9GAMM|nr:TIGR01621 family pseudouridine synthase [Marinomonas pollencensis]REG83269.1 tRNA pseudouridine32 synthase/23S rRNA pseudouridine746 synthase [Marinomonas pollencensis]
MLNIIFRCDDFWLINKPAGMSFHGESETLGVMQTLKSEYPDHEFYPVHRLDKITSGLLLVALHYDAAVTFGKMFEQHQIEKRYLAISNRKPKKKQGTVRGGMMPSRRGQWKLTQGTENLAVTQFFSAAFEGRRVFLLRPLTGKTHQIRVALKSVGSPILGDGRYGGDPSERGYLHAYYLRFMWQGVEQEFRCSPTEGEHFSSAFCEFIESNFQEASLKWPASQSI